MNRYFVYIPALILAACDSGTPTSVVTSEPESNPDPIPIYDTAIADLQIGLEDAKTSKHELKNDFEARKAELLSKIAAAKRDHDALRSIQAEHYAALENEFEKASKMLKEAKGDMAIWNPIQLDTISVMRDEMIRLHDENTELKAEIKLLKQTRP